MVKFKSLEAAKAGAKEIIQTLTTGVAHVATFTPKETASINDAVDILTPLEISLTDAVRQFAEAHKILRGGSIVSAAQFYKKAAALYKKQNPEFKEKEIHQKVEVGKLDILDTRKMKDGAGVSHEAVDVEAEGNLIRTGTLNKIEFREVAKFKITFFFVRNPDLMGNGRLPLVVQDFKYEETPL